MTDLVFTIQRGLSRHTRYTVHRSDCVYVQKASHPSDRFDTIEGLETKLAIGIAHGCKRCKPDLSPLVKNEKLKERLKNL